MCKGYRCILCFYNFHIRFWNGRSWRVVFIFDGFFFAHFHSFPLFSVSAPLSLPSSSNSSAGPSSPTSNSTPVDIINKLKFYIDKQQKYVDTCNDKQRNESTNSDSSFQKRSSSDTSLKRDSVSSDIGSKKNSFSSDIGSTKDSFSSDVSSKKDSCSSDIGSKKDSFSNDVSSKKDSLNKKDCTNSDSSLNKKDSFNTSFQSLPGRPWQIYYNIFLCFVGKLVGSVFPRSCDLCPVSSLSHFY